MAATAMVATAMVATAMAARAAELQFSRSLATPKERTQSVIFINSNRCSVSTNFDICIITQEYNLLLNNFQY